MTSILEGLNKEQAEAVKTIHGPLLVLAGAGTGKTRVITYRIAYMIENHISPASILGLTFTNKASREMQTRLATLVPKSEANLVTLSTFHSFCCMVLRKDIVKLKGFDRKFTIAGDNDQQSMIKQAIIETGYGKDDKDNQFIRGKIGDKKNNLITVAEAMGNIESNFDLKVAKVYERYQQILKNQNMLDFDDLLMFVIKIWGEFPDVLKKYQNKFQYLLVDEYQDTNQTQFRLLEMLTQLKSNLCVVGDDDQSIYGWRGAEVKHILDFPNFFKNTKMIKLECNYRSTNNILELANYVICQNSIRHEKELWSNKGKGDLINIIKTPSANEEALFVVDSILEQIFSDKNIPHSNFAILYRSNHMSRLLETELRKAKIPYHLVGSRSFFQRKEILDAIAYLHLLVNPKDNQGLLRIISTPPRGFGDKAIATLKQLHLDSNKSFLSILSTNEFKDTLSTKARDEVSKLIETIHKYQTIFETPGDLAEKSLNYLNDIGYIPGLMKIYKKIDDATKRKENILELINAIAEFENSNKYDNTLFSFFENFALNDDSDDEDNDNAVTLMTIHAAKGLEFPFVFLVGMEKDIFPHIRSIEEKSEEEERRLFYVAITRAESNLIITHAEKRMQYGKEQTQIPSPFIRYLPEKLIMRHKSPHSYFKPMSKDDVKNSLQKILDSL